ncbi:hypothetical protein O1611_g7761 [Lasiodiplodia mahajangana]|uniref:Uncharacterized protein n=1 Tax=Lasiodiplodia mahajangana TaxID=1108764 RepID=A0ACC2JF73_9PEZI|nr:hypothetical protein O1611_g7761 [Lasiodiplodia mahajangana]
MSGYVGGLLPPHHRSFSNGEMETGLVFRLYNKPAAEIKTGSEPHLESYGNLEALLPGAGTYEHTSIDQPAEPLAAGAALNR